MEIANQPDLVAQAVADIARQLIPPKQGSGGRPAAMADMGLLAKLRRFDPATQGKACVFETTQVLLKAGVEAGLGGVDAERLRVRWAVLVHCLALAKGAHDPGGPGPGEGLAALQLSEARLRQLLQADEALLLQLMPLLARRLSAHGVAIDWLPLARLLLHAELDEPRAERARARIAQGYIEVARSDKTGLDSSTDENSLTGSNT